MTLALLVVFALGGGPVKPGTIRWEHRLEDALKKAKSSGKPVMVDFWAEWCGWCHRLDQTTYVDPEVTKLVAADFVAVKVDTEAGKRSASSRPAAVPSIASAASRARAPSRARWRW